MTRKNDINYNNKRHAKYKFTATALVLLLTLAALFAACSPVEKSGADGSSNGGQANEAAPEAASPGQNAEQNAGQSQDEAPLTDAAAPEADAPALISAVGDGEDIVIPISDISTTATFYPASVNGIDLEVLAVKAPDGTIRTAFNTCQVCYDSGRGFYKQDGDVLVCQNCGNRFPMSHVEVESGGCNPWPIFDEYKTVTDTEITIPADFLAEATVIFQNWKGNY